MESAALGILVLGLGVLAESAVCPLTTGAASPTDDRTNSMPTSTGKRTAKVRTTLTTRAVETFQPADKPWIAWDDKLTGFGLRVQPLGTGVTLELPITRQLAAILERRQAEGPTPVANPARTPHRDSSRTSPTLHTEGIRLRAIGRNPGQIFPILPQVGEAPSPAAPLHYRSRRGVQIDFDPRIALDRRGHAVHAWIWSCQAF